MATHTRLRSPSAQLPRHRITWPSPGELLLAIEPSRDEVAHHAAALAAAYSDPHDAPLLGHTAPCALQIAEIQIAMR